MSRHDVYSKDWILTSIDTISPEFLYHIRDKSCSDSGIDRLREAMEFAIGLMSEDEARLLFFRFIQGNSYKTLKKSINVGSSKTTHSRTVKLMKVVKSYVNYYLTNDYNSDLDTIENKLGGEARIIAEQLFLRKSKNRIFKSDVISISKNRLARMINDIELLCNGNDVLFRFWDVIEEVGNLSKKLIIF